MTGYIVQDPIITRSHTKIAMKWHDVLKESVSPDSFKEKYLRVLCVSSAAGGESIRPFQGHCHATLFRGGD